ncbi:hypothetical protein OGAPHI_002743 [Ogataea philodendri]|uniref:Uncharacterized protein n=1 Tax=Ogataea philodendri TaxID=1378263 RepID=A0A9P8T7B6_9ASCO|nr:uncharacterized protein OGAPHI_002743 [Ogataea philodendri]KAH3668988.1 hypothetical protein OGAPHI_002743 [Ogataea philodendri]
MMAPYATAPTADPATIPAILPPLTVTDPDCVDFPLYESMDPSPLSLPLSLPWSELAPPVPLSPVEAVPVPITPNNPLKGTLLSINAARELSASLGL